jgi:hypothetical protein
MCTAGSNYAMVIIMHMPTNQPWFTKLIFKEQKIEVLLYPAYSPDLSPYDFWLNPYITVAGLKPVVPLEARSASV